MNILFHTYLTYRTTNILRNQEENGKNIVTDKCLKFLRLMLIEYISINMNNKTIIWWVVFLHWNIYIECCLLIWEYLYCELSFDIQRFILWLSLDIGISLLLNRKKFSTLPCSKEIGSENNCMISLKPLLRSYKDFGHKKEKIPRLQFWSVLIVYSSFMFLVIFNPIGYLESKGWFPEDPDGSIPPL
ncbi:hypothetical protein Avbf_04970 [Armadillidium vulgare]|nr:hypothetical protein Avbf_04970 [Armadillidium vulgare]